MYYRIFMTMNHLSSQDIVRFQHAVMTFYAQNRRDMPWRQPEKDGTYDPYKILVSELMLQQTQVARVVPKYEQFLAVFPSVEVLASAELAEVLKLWSGLGYNRRAKYLWRAAQVICSQYGGAVPLEVQLLQELPGVGHNTAAAICAYAAEKPVVFIETNIRTVYLRHFFFGQDKVRDAEILELVSKTLLDSGIRDWYYALMDLGTHYKTVYGNPNKQSTSYSKQKAFHGSLRQVRGAILKLLVVAPQSGQELKLKVRDERLDDVLQTLDKERLIHRKKTVYYLGEK